MPDPNTVTMRAGNSMHARDSKNYTYKVLADLGDFAPANPGESFTMWWWGDEHAQVLGNGMIIKRSTLDNWLQGKKVELVEPSKSKRVKKEEPKAKSEGAEAE